MSARIYKIKGVFEPTGEWQIVHEAFDHPPSEGELYSRTMLMYPEVLESKPYPVQKAATSRVMYKKPVKKRKMFKDDPVGYLIKRSASVNAFSGKHAKSDGRGGWKVRPSYGRKKTSGITVVIRSTKGSKRFLVTSAKAGQALIRRAAKYRNFVNGYMTR